MQLMQVDTDSQQNLAVIFDNAGRSKIRGAELEIQWVPMPGALLNLSFSKNDYSLEEFTDADLMKAILGNSDTTVDRSDEPFPVSPEGTASVGFQYALSTDVGIFIPRIDVSYKKRYLSRLGPRLFSGLRAR